MIVAASADSHCPQVEKRERLSNSSEGGNKLDLLGVICSTGDRGRGKYERTSSTNLTRAEAHYHGQRLWYPRQRCPRDVSFELSKYNLGE